MIVVATDEEYTIARKRFKHSIIIKTGVGGINVYRKLKRLPKWLKITNYGYVGSNKLTIGQEVEIKECQLYHPNVEYEEPTYKIKTKSKTAVKCYTSNDFVLETKIEEPCVFDMELAYILAMGFKRVKSIKIVSDNLSKDEYKKSLDTLG